MEYGKSFYHELAQSIIEDLPEFSGSGKTYRHSNGKEWYVDQLINHVDWSDVLLKDILDLISIFDDWRESFDRIFPNLASYSLTVQEKGRVRSIIFALLASAAQKGIRLPASLRWGSVPIADELLNWTKWSLCYPRIAIELNAEAKRPEQKKSYLPYIQKEVIQDFTPKRTTLTANVSFISRFMICCGVCSYENMTPELFSDFMIESHRIDPDISIPWKQVCTAMESNGILPTGWCVDVESLFKQRPLDSKHLSKSRNCEYYGYIRAIPSQAKTLLGDLCYYDGIKKVYTPEFRTTFIEIGDFKIATATTEYSPENIPDGAWRRAQLAYLDLSEIERGTAKVRGQELQLLNAYLFGYLPWFFDENPKCFFKYPDAPSKFLPSVFVRIDTVLDNEYKKQTDKNGLEVIYPISLIDFINEFAVARSTSNYTERNSVRNTLAHLRRFFNRTKEKYHALEEFDLSINPIPEVRDVGYKKREKITKEMFDLQYWIIFRIFLKEITKVLLIISAKRVCRALSEEKSPALDALNVAMRDICSMDGFKHLQNVNDIDSNDYVDVPTSIEAFNKEHHIGKIEYPYFASMIKKLEMGNGRTRVELTNFYFLMVTLVAAYAGQRGSNAANLCADTFDADYVSLPNGEIKERLVPLRIYTDKVKPNGLDSVIQEDIMVMLRFVKKIRDLVTNNAFVNPIPYQGNEKSKFKPFYPLLQSTAKTTKGIVIYETLTPYIKMYEDWLRKVEIPFDSKLAYAPINSTLEQVEIAIRRQSPLIIKPYLLKYEEDKEPRPFTPIILKTKLTLHSFRAQLVTVINVATGDKEAVKMVTGQTDGSIDFYTKPDPNLSKQLASIRNSKTQSVVGVSDLFINENELISAINQSDDAELPFFSNEPIGLQALKESGGRGLAFNYTHICPHNNDCPDEIVTKYGRMHCDACPRACISHHHKIAIAATIKKHLDDVKDYSYQIGETTNQAEKSVLRASILNSIIIASNWLVRLKFIEQNPGRFIIPGAEEICHYKAIPSNSVSNELLARMQETNGVPSLQSERLKRVASRTAGKLQVMFIRNELPNFMSSNTDELNNDPVRFVVRNLLLIADLMNTTPEKLLDEHNGESAQHLLEGFSIDG